MYNKLDHYPPNAFRSGCATSGAGMRKGETFVVELPMPPVAEKRADGTYIPNRRVCLSIEAATQVGATVGMREGADYDRVVAQLAEAEARIEALEEALAAADARADEARSGQVAELVAAVREQLAAETAAPATEPGTVPVKKPRAPRKAST